MLRSDLDASGRAAFQVLVLPYRQVTRGFEHAVLWRADVAQCHGVPGGGEADEYPMQAARRETAEEAGLTGDLDHVAPDAMTTVPVVHVTGEFTWGPKVLVIPHFAFGVRAVEHGFTRQTEPGVGPVVRTTRREAMQALRDRGSVTGR